jgi:hypothetical protein
MTLGERIFRLVLRSWPDDFRGAYTESMLATFSRREERLANRGLAVRWLFVVREVASAVRISVDLRLTRGRRLGRFALSRLEVRQSLRSLTRRPLFAVLVVTTLTVGVGLNAAAFAVVDAVVLEPLRPPGATSVGSTSPTTPASSPWTGSPATSERTP